MGTRKYIVTLTSKERERLTRLVSSGRDKAYRIKHANILLAADENGPNLIPLSPLISPTNCKVYFEK